MNKIQAVDLFCGAGGTSTGLRLACQKLGYDLNLLAINHWDVAIATHSANHPEARHLCESLDNVNPRKVVPGGYLDILVASPECTHHSNARGGRPMSDQSRSSGWHILRWAEALRIENILIENVKEFQSWGPLGADGRPLKSKRGETFHAFLNALRALNYTVEYKVLNAANFGDPTTRERLFIMAKRGRKKIVWPEPTHTPTGETTLFGKTKPWRSAREIIDWNIPGKSIFERKKPLAANTMRRIEAGLRKFCGKEIEPFLVMLYGTNDARSIDRPAPTVTTSGSHVALCEPFILPQMSGGSCRNVGKPIPTITTTSRGIGLVQPFLVPMKGKSKPQSIKKPVPALTTKEYVGVCEPFLVKFYGNEKEGAPVSRPMPTITVKDRLGICEPFIVGIGQTGGKGHRVRSIEKPLPTLVTKQEMAICQPEIKGYKLDIRFRMLQPRELARTMSFGDDYQFKGSRGDQVKQIGNAVPVGMATNLCLGALGRV